MHIARGGAFGSLAALGVLVFASGACTRLDAAEAPAPDESFLASLPVNLQGTFVSKETREMGIRLAGIACVKNALTIEGWEISSVSQLYDDVACKGPIVAKVVVEGSYTLGGYIASATGVRELDWTIRKVMLYPVDRAWAQAVGSELLATCGLDKIPFGQGHEITGRDCGRFGRYPRRDSVYYTSFRSAARVIYFGRLPQNNVEFVSARDQPYRRNYDLDFAYARL